MPCYRHFGFIFLKCHALHGFTDSDSVTKRYLDTVNLIDLVISTFQLLKCTTLYTLSTPLPCTQCISTYSSLFLPYRMPHRLKFILTVDTSPSTVLSTLL